MSGVTDIMEIRIMRAVQALDARMDRMEKMIRHFDQRVAEMDARRKEEFGNRLGASLDAIIAKGKAHGAKMDVPDSGPAFDEHGAPVTGPDEGVAKRIERGLYDEAPPGPPTGSTPPPTPAPTPMDGAEIVDGGIADNPDAVPAGFVTGDGTPEGSA